MAEQTPKSPPSAPPPPPPPPHQKLPHPPEEAAAAAARGWSAHGYPNPPDAANPDPATLREQWRFAIRQYSRWYSHAWGTAILAGAAFFALGWIVKGSNPLPSRSDHRADDEKR
ncbi:LIX1-like protein [Ananas comosus]|uniref:LIX1-like protein n=1 Tax=Ananas comosus TaxID=4615 RepID=A0A6P5F1A4_ANACO|nr:LIX1-like protein [Ananas comosus]